MASTKSRYVKEISARVENLDTQARSKMKSIILELLILFRLITNDGIMLENRRPQPKRQPVEVIRFIRRPAKRGRKLK